MREHVEIIIACHNEQRPLARAVASILDGNGEHAEVTVVAHNIDPERLKANLHEQHRERVRFLHLVDGLRSPAGPFNYGLENARRSWVSIMGSDDTLMPGAVKSWLALARATGAEAVITHLFFGSSSRPVPTPPVRPLRKGVRHFWRDRLAYRSAPLGLMSKSMISRLHLQFLPGLAVGEDVIFTTKMLAQARIAVGTRGPGYVIGEDANDRVTYVIRPMTEQLAFVRPTLEDSWFARLEPAAKLSVVMKYLRIHVFGIVHYRPQAIDWYDGDREELAALTGALIAAAPRAERVMSRAEHALATACQNPAVPTAELTALSRARRAHGHPSTILTQSPSALFHREAPLRFMAASAFAALP